MLAILGEGGSGVVFEAASSSGEHVAIKCLRPNVVNAQRKKRFKNEMDFCLRTRHPNILRVVDTGVVTWDTTSVPFFVAPIFPSTLRKLMDAKVPTENVLPLFSKILDGVEAAHLLGVTHRDLKPENILCDTAGQIVVVADFGIAHFDEEMAATMIATKESEKLANLRYSAPEQRARGEVVDQRADIYALGLILNELFTANVPQGAGYRQVGPIAPQYAFLDGVVEQMIQHRAQARPNRIEDIKKEFIGRQNEFVARQELDAKRREVVASKVPGTIEPITLIAADWNRGTLSLRLNRIPEGGWVTKFRNPGSHTSVLGAGPEAFQFQGDVAIVSIDGDNAQRVIDYFKQWLPNVTAQFQQETIAAAARQDREKKEQMRREIEELEKRERIVRQLKI